MSCEVKKGKGLFLKSYKDCRMHCREFHQEFVSLFKCSVLLQGAYILVLEEDTFPSREL